MFSASDKMFQKDENLYYIVITIEEIGQRIKKLGQKTEDLYFCEILEKSLNSF